MHDIRSVVKDDGILCLDNGMYKLWFARHYKVCGWVGGWVTCRVHSRRRRAHAKWGLLRCCWAYMQAHLPNTILLDNALATMGAGLPSAIATKLLHPDRQVVAIVGDGGFLMNSQVRATGPAHARPRGVQGPHSAEGRQHRDVGAARAGLCRSLTAKRLARLRQVNTLAARPE